MDGKDLTTQNCERRTAGADSPLERKTGRARAGENTPKPRVRQAREETLRTTRSYRQRVFAGNACTCIARRCRASTMLRIRT